MRIVVSGSIGYDYIMFFPGYFREHILPEHINKLSVSFLVDSLKKQRGGCAPNIAYNCCLLGECATVMGTVGQDFADYSAWLEAHKVDTSAIRVIPDEFTASFFVSTDRDNNQIASFYPGAMQRARELSFHDLPYRDIGVAIISPNDPEAMRRNVRECRELRIPYIYDPSQQIIRLDAADLEAGARSARVLVVNDYEFEMIRNKTGMSAAELEHAAPTVIVTQGKLGSTIIDGRERFQIPVVEPLRIADPTGVGDAYRAGIVKGLLNGYPWPVAGRMASLAAAYCLEQHGTQNHSYTWEQFLARYRQTFGEAPAIQ
jgi:adenosine kinase